MDHIIIDWEKLKSVVKLDSNPNPDIRVAHILLDKIGVEYNHVNAFIDDSGDWKLAVD